jgi:hypothetical protein
VVLEGKTHFPQQIDGKWKMGRLKIRGVHAKTNQCIEKCCKM